VVAGRTSRRRLLSGEAEQVVALGQGQMQTLGHRGDHLIGGVRSACSFQA